MAGMKDKLGDVPYPPPPRAFDGQTYEPIHDFARLRGQLERVNAFMADGRFHTLNEIARAAGGTEASVSARLRDLRKPKYGSRDVKRERVTGGLFRYRLVL
jgi:hypothetical protein